MRSIVRFLLRQLKGAILHLLSDETVRIKLYIKLNEKLDLPAMSEEEEQRLIHKAADATIDALKEILDEES